MSTPPGSAELSKTRKLPSFARFRYQAAAIPLMPPPTMAVRSPADLSSEISLGAIDCD